MRKEKSLSASEFLSKYRDDYSQLSLDDKEIVYNEFMDIWLDEKIEEAEQQIEEEKAAGVFSSPFGGPEDIHKRALFLACLLHNEREVEDNEVYQLVENVLFDLVYYLDEREIIKKKLNN